MMFEEFDRLSGMTFAVYLSVFKCMKSEPQAVKESIARVVWSLQA